MSYSPVLNPHPVAQSGAWSVSVANWPGTQQVSIAATVNVAGPLTDTQLRATAVPVSGTFWQATQPVSIAATVAVSGPLTDTQLRTSAVPVSIATMPSTPVTGTFWQATQPVSIAATVNVAGPLTDTQLRATAVPVSGTFFQATQPVSIAATVAVSGPLTDTQLRAIAVPVSGTFWQATQPVSIAATVNVAGPLTDTQLRASAVPVSIATMPSTPVTGTFWQATQPVSIAAAVAVTPPTLTKGTQAATGFSVQELKDAGRSTLCMTAEFAFAQAAETLLTMTLSVDGAATSTFSSRAITSGKKFRIQSIDIEVESLGSGTAPQRAYLRLRRNTAGATTASSALQAVWSCINNTAIVKSGVVQHFDVPDGMEMNGDGTATFGFTLETPDWVTTTATGRAKITIVGVEF